MFVWTVGDAIGLSLLAVFLLVSLIVALWTAFKQYFCKHERYSETMACDAVCLRCGKNLGFIGNIRQRSR